MSATLTDLKGSISVDLIENSPSSRVFGDNAVCRVHAHDTCRLYLRGIAGVILDPVVAFARQSCCIEIGRANFGFRGELTFSTSSLRARIAMVGN